MKFLIKTYSRAAWERGNETLYRSAQAMLALHKRGLCTPKAAFKLRINP